LWLAEFCGSRLAEAAAAADLLLLLLLLLLGNFLISCLSLPLWCCHMSLLSYYCHTVVVAE
jgi:hypothetical protein